PASAPNRRVVGAYTAQTISPPAVAPRSRPNLLIAPTYTSRGPGWDGVNMQLTSLCDVIIKPMPPEMSHVSVPDLTRSACAMVTTGNATVVAIARAAITLNGVCISNSFAIYDGVSTLLELTSSEKFRTGNGPRNSRAHRLKAS